VNKNPNQALDPVRGEFVKFMLSKQGQAATVKDGYFPLPAAIAMQDLKGLGLSK
jgi:phosphate transport system substrate-binding protein